MRRSGRTRAWLGARGGSGPSGPSEQSAGWEPSCRPVGSQEAFTEEVGFGPCLAGGKHSWGSFL